MSDPDIIEAEVILQDSTFSPEQVANQLVSLCRSALRNAPATDRAYDTDTPGLGGFLWGIWGALIALAEEDASRHDRLASILAEMKVQGREDWIIWGEPFDWAVLPIFGPSVRESFNGPIPSGDDDMRVAGDDPDYLDALSGGPPTGSNASLAGARARLRWLNMNAFLARLWTLDVWDGAFYAIATMRMSLEPHSRPVYSSHPGCQPDSIELEIEVATVWVRVAGRRIFECREIMGPKGNPDWSPQRGCPGGSGGTWDGVDGFHPDRWQHWKGIFRDISKGRWRSNVIDAAKAAVEAMERVERDPPAAGESTIVN